MNSDSTQETVLETRTRRWAFRGWHLVAAIALKGGSQLAPPPTICCGAANQSHEQFLARLWAP